MMKSNRLFGPVFIFCILFLNFGPCHAQEYSPQFQALLNQIQQIYLAPKGENISVLRSQYCEVMAALIGHALRQQMMYVQQNPSLNNQFTILRQDAQVFITDLARTTSARMQDGNPYPPDGLWYIVNKVYQGQEEEWIQQNFRVQTGAMPSVLAARSVPQKPGPPVGDPLIKSEEKTQIDLFGNVAPPVKGSDTCDGPAYWSPQCNGYRQKREAAAEAERNRSRALNPDGIQGENWSSIGGTRLRIWKQGDLYLGSMSGKTEYLYYNYKPNAICLRLKYVGKSEKGLIFKGQYCRVGLIKGTPMHGVMLLSFTLLSPEKSVLARVKTYWGRTFRDNDHLLLQFPSMTKLMIVD